MADAERSGEPPRAALERRARQRGRELGADAAATGAPASGPCCGSWRIRASSRGLEDGVVTLANCPFHALAQEHTELVCGMNLRLLDGVLESVPGGGLVARLQPAPGRCCVRMEPATTS